MSSVCPNEQQLIKSTSTFCFGFAGKGLKDVFSFQISARATQYCIEQACYKTAVIQLTVFVIWLL